jgi:serine/threonine-protein kinase RsbW
MTRAISLTISSDPEQLAPVRHAVEKLASDLGFDSDAIAKIGLCVNEALANVIRHAYHGSTDQPMQINAEPTNVGLKIIIRDWGDGVNPDTLPPKPHDPLKPGGLGLICMREMMDEVIFEPQDKGMQLTMNKKRADRPDENHSVGAAA